MQVSFIELMDVAKEEDGKIASEKYTAFESAYYTVRRLSPWTTPDQEPLQLLQSIALLGRECHQFKILRDTAEQKEVAMTA